MIELIEELGRQIDWGIAAIIFVVTVVICWLRATI